MVLRGPVLVLLLVACSGPAAPAPDATPDGDALDGAAADTAPEVRPSPPPAAHSGALAVTPDGRLAFAADPSTDEVAVVDLHARVALSPWTLGAPSRAGGRHDPTVGPRAVALDPSGELGWVACERSGEILRFSVADRRVLARRRVCAGPVAVLAHGAGALVACTSEARVLALDASLAVIDAVAVPEGPYALARAQDGRTLAVTQLRGPAVTVLSLEPLRFRAALALPEVPARGHPALAHGVPRGAFDAVWRPGTEELWAPHTLYATDTAAPALNFESTVFPAVAVLGARAVTFSHDARLEGVDGAFRHVLSGPRALAFTPDGARAVLVGHNSENALCLDGPTGEERGFAEDLGALLDGVALTDGGARAWVWARGDNHLQALRVSPEGGLSLDGPAVPARARDPMPSNLREGQRVFHTANDRYQQFPITVNHWIACESCHLDEGTAAVTLRLPQGPRDIPSLPGGVDGFLLRTATRARVQDFWRTINDEQGGSFRPDDVILGPSLDRLAEYVTTAIPAPPPPPVDPALAARGRALFEAPSVGCAGCHRGPRGTDSGDGNPAHTLSGAVLLHDVGTCVREGPWPDRAHQDTARRPRDGCRYDTPALVGLAASAPYLHDGGAPTLRAVLTDRNPEDRHGRTSALSPDAIDALVAYLLAR
jgi:DNA-binding beta-propeller fold protein YncE